MTRSTDITTHLTDRSRADLRSCSIISTDQTRDTQFSCKNTLSQNNSSMQKSSGDQDNHFTYFAYGISMRPDDPKVEIPRYNIWDSPIEWSRSMIQNNPRPLYVDVSSRPSVLVVDQDIKSNHLSNSSLTSDSSTSESSSPDSSISESNGSDPDSSDDSGGDCREYQIPCMEIIKPYRSLELTPSYFASGCICGHNIEYRGMFCDERKRKHVQNRITIHPKTPPITVILNNL